MKAKLQALQSLSRRQAARVGAAAGTAVALLASPLAHAAIDVSATTAELGDAKTAVLAVGVAVMAIAVGIMLYKWIKRAL
jgi:hypothetical protein